MNEKPVNKYGAKIPKITPKYTKEPLTKTPLTKNQLTKTSLTNMVQKHPKLPQNGRPLKYTKKTLRNNPLTKNPLKKKSLTKNPLTENL